MKGDLQVYLPNQMLFREGDPSGGLYFIKEGKIDIIRERDGTEIVLATLNPGDVLGTVTVLSREPRTASARAQTQASLVWVSGESLEKSLKEVPMWAVAILKDTVARLKGVDELLCEAKLSEKKLKQRVGSSMHHGAQLASLLAGMMKLGTIEEEGVQLFPLKGFIPRAETTLLQRAEYLQTILDCLTSGGLAKQVEDKKWGVSIQSPKPALAEDFATFCRAVAKEGPKGFAPSKLGNWMSALVRLGKKFPDREFWPEAELLSALSTDLGRTGSDAILAELNAHGVIRPKPGSTTGEVGFSAAQVQRRLVFEGCCRLLKDVQAEAT